MQLQLFHHEMKAVADRTCRLMLIHAWTGLDPRPNAQHHGDKANIRSRRSWQLQAVGGMRYLPAWPQAKLEVAIAAAAVALGCTLQATHTDNAVSRAFLIQNTAWHMPHCMHFHADTLAGPQLLADMQAKVTPTSTEPVNYHSPYGLTMRKPGTGKNRQLGFKTTAPQDPQGKRGMVCLVVEPYLGCVTCPGINEAWCSQHHLYAQGVALQP